MKAAPVRLGAGDEDFSRLKLRRDTVGPWEDGMRTHGGRGSYEWWYFDAHLDDGSKIVIVFYTKPLADVRSPLRPHVAITLDDADGTHHERKGFWPPDAFEASRDRCDVRIGAQRFASDGTGFEISVDIEGLSCRLRLEPTLPPWRPATGQLLFEEDGSRSFSWLPAVPEGRVDARIDVAGRVRRVGGTGYHDHNWGDFAIARLLHHWYWARAKVGPYTVIAAHLVAERRYGHAGVNVFMLARDGRIVADDASLVTFSAADIEVDGPTGKPVARLTSYELREGEATVGLRFMRLKTLLRMPLVETLPPVTRILARLAGFDGAFLRFTGDVRLQRCASGQPVESHDGQAIWELMYFGRTSRRDPDRAAASG